MQIMTTAAPSLAAREHEILVSGILLPGDFDEDGSFTGIVLATPDGNEFVLVPGASGADGQGGEALNQMAPYIHERVFVVGRPAFAGRRRYLHVRAMAEATGAPGEYPEDLAGAAGR